MYLNDAQDLDGVIIHGINPLVELLHIFEDEFLDVEDLNSTESILWHEIKGKALRIKEKARIIQKGIYGPEKPGQ
jgi:hypothetical protein